MPALTRDEKLSAFAHLREGLIELARRLPPSLRHRLDVGRRRVAFEIHAPTTSHRHLCIEASPGHVEHQFGRLWTENLTLDHTTADTLLAACDAVFVGRVREVKDLRTGIYYHVYRLTTRGPKRFIRDTEYHPLHYLPLRIRQVSIRRISALV